MIELGRSGALDSYWEFLRTEAAAHDIRIPTARTLAQYGLTERAWLVIFHGQQWECPICCAKAAHWNIDHQHVPGWKKMKAKERVKFVRGILCWRCNKNNAPSNLSAAEAFRLAQYLQSYESRRDK